MLYERRSVRGGHNNVTRVTCDGAKSSCAAKIASAVECALFAYELAKEGHVFQPGEGMVKDTVEETIKSIGRMGRVGMHETDIEILNRVY